MKIYAIFFFVLISNFLNAQLTEKAICDLYTTALNEIGKNVVVEKYVLQPEYDNFTNDRYIVSYFDSLNMNIESLDKRTNRMDLSDFKCFGFKLLFLSKYNNRIQKYNFIFRYKQRNVSWCYLSGIIYNNKYALFYISEYSGNDRMIYYHYFLFEKEKKITLKKHHIVY